MEKDASIYSGEITMLQIANTPNYAGIKVTGDFHDFDQLYEALHEIVGNEDENLAYYNARLRVLGLCYDLRHANMGTWVDEITFMSTME